MKSRILASMGALMMAAGMLASCCGNRDCCDEPCARPCKPICCPAPKCCPPPVCNAPRDCCY